MASLLVAACLLALGAAAEVQVRLLPNGASWRVTPAVWSGDSWEGLRQHVEGSGMGTLGANWWLADPDGLRVESWAEVLAMSPERRTFNVVPEGRPFQWGPRRAGERFPVKLQGREGVEIETVATTPGIFLIHNLFTQAEAMFLIDRATKRTGANALQKSGIGLSQDGVRSRAAVRTSSNAFDADSPGAVALIERSFEVLRMNYSKPMADGLQILRYDLGQAYIAHTDWFSPGAGGPETNFDPATPGGSNRYATVFLYLYPPPTGGYTVFPKANIEEDIKSNAFVSIGDNPQLLEEQLRLARAHFNESKWEVEMTRDCYTKLAVKPVRLGAALFYHQDPMTGKLLDEAEHGACPSMTGTKWGANLWVWNAERIYPGGNSERMKPCSVVFRNTHAAPLVLEFSTDDQASWTAFSTVEPGGVAKSDTYPYHHWRFMQDGKVVRIWAVPLGLTTKTLDSRDAPAQEL